MAIFGKDKEKDKSDESKLPNGEAGLSALEELEKRRQERLGLPSGTPETKRGRKPKAEALQDELTKDLFKPAIWEEVASLPFNVRKAMTGSAIFDLNSDQKKALGTPLALIMQMLSIIDPKYLALLVFTINLTTIWAEKEILYSIEKKKRIKTVKSEALKS